MTSALMRTLSRISRNSMLFYRHGMVDQQPLSSPITANQFRLNHVTVKQFETEKFHPTLHHQQSLTIQYITKNLSLITGDSVQIKYNRNSLKLDIQRKKPLALIISWLLSKEQHLKKIAEIYTSQGFDVLIARHSPWELLFPEKGVLIVAKQIVDFLHVNNGYSSIVFHGFSVAGFCWAEVMIRMADDLGRYQSLVHRIRAQIHDSVVHYQNLPFGVAYTLFPDNSALQWPVKTALENHMKYFHNYATRYYERSYKIFRDTIVPAPALFLVSKDDPLGTENACLPIFENWSGHRGISVTWKCWEKSPHVGHFAKHRNEYLQLVFNHLKSVDLLKDPENLQTKL